MRAPRVRYVRHADTIMTVTRKKFVIFPGPEEKRTAGPQGEHQGQFRGSPAGVAQWFECLPAN